MIGFIKMIMTTEFLIGAIFGLVAMYIFKPLVDAGLKKLFNKND